MSETKLLILTIFFIFCFKSASLTVSNQDDKTDKKSSIENEFCDKEGCPKAESSASSASSSTQKCKIFRLSEFGPKNASIVYGGASGRLGNQLLSYAALIQLQRQLGVQSYTDAENREYMNEYFTPDVFELNVLSEAFCNPKDIPFEAYDGHIKFLLTDAKYRKGKLIHFFPRVDSANDKIKGGYKPEDHVSKEQEHFQNGYIKYLRQKLKFRTEINTRVKKTLKKVAKKIGKKPKEMTYVGIHNRRTDHLEFIKKTADMVPIEIDYFYDAMDYFREEFENVAFLYVSDDMEWGRKNLKNDNNGDLFFVGAGEDLKAGEKSIAESVSFDLALLMSCNHTIITRGTFSMWAGALAGGEFYTEYGTIVPQELMNPEN